MSDYSRQKDIFDVEKFNLPVHVIGAGATGSWVALLLAKLGVKDIHAWDFDIVAEHNLPNQFFALNDIGNTKVTALQHEVLKVCDVCITPHNMRVDGKQRLSGIVFMLTDTMKSRKEIYEKAVKLKVGVKLLIETRMGLSEGRIYTINPMDMTETSEYEKTFYGDDEAHVSACGTSQSIITTAMSIASMAVRQMINYINNKPLNHELLIDFENNAIYNRKYEVS